MWFFMGPLYLFRLDFHHCPTSYAVFSDLWKEGLPPVNMPLACVLARPSPSPSFLYHTNKGSPWPKFHQAPLKPPSKPRHDFQAPMLISALPSFSGSPTKSVWRKFSIFNIRSPLISDQVPQLQPPGLLWSTFSKNPITYIQPESPYPFSDFPSTHPQLSPWLSTCPCIWSWAQF